MRHRKNSSDSGNPLLPLFTTSLLIAGIVGVAYISSNGLPKNGSASDANTATSSTATGSISTSTQQELALVTDMGVTIVSLDGHAIFLTTEDFSKRVAGPFRPVIASNAATGEQKMFQLGSVTATVPLLAPDHKHGARMIAPRPDGASVVDFALPGEAAQTVVLRIGSQPIHEGVVETWSDSKTLLIGGTVSGARFVYRVSLDGAIAQVAQLPDSALWMVGQDSAVWYVTAEQGEGLESEPRAPSTLHRVTATADKQVYADDKRVIMSVVANNGTAFAVRLSDGTSLVRAMESSSAAVDLGKRQAVLFLPDGRLVVRNGFALEYADASMTTFTKITDLPAGQVRVSLMPIRLDELPTTP